MPIQTDQEKIQLMLETMGIEGIKAAELAYDKLEKQVLDVEKASGTLKQQAKELTSTEYEVVVAADKSADAMRKNAAASYAASQAIEKTVVPAAQNTTIAFKDVGRSMLDVEKVTTSLASGHGMMRLAQPLERLTGLLGGPAGMGFAILGVINGLEVMVPKFLQWINADNAKHAKEIADAAQKQADAVKQMKEQLTTEEEKIKKATEAQIKEMPGARVVEAIAGTLTEEARRREITQLDIDKAMPEIGEMGPMAREQTIETIRETRIKAAQDLATKITATLGTDMESRREALRLAKTYPAAFPPEFREQIGAIDQPGYMVPAEKIKAEQAERAAVKEIEEAKKPQIEQLRKRIHERQAIANKAQEEKDERVSREAAERAKHWREMMAQKEAGAKEEAGKVQRADDEARRVAKHEADKAAREAAHAATPAGRRAAEHKQLERFVDQAGLTLHGMPAPEGYKAQMVHGAEENLAAGTAQTMAQAVWQAINKYNAKLENEFQRAMSGQAQHGAGLQEKVNGMQMWVPPGTNGY